MRILPKHVDVFTGSPRIRSILENILPTTSAPIALLYNLLTRFSVITLSSFCCYCFLFFFHYATFLSHAMIYYMLLSEFFKKFNPPSEKL